MVDPVKRLPFHGKDRTGVAKQREVVAARATQVNLMDQAKHGRTRQRRHVQRGVTIQATFTITLEQDQQIHQRALSENISRSAVVRQALLHYLEG